jgi:hypothetical protein
MMETSEIKILQIKKENEQLRNQLHGARARAIRLQLAKRTIDEG